MSVPPLKQPGAAWKDANDGHGRAKGVSSAFVCPYANCRVFALHLWGNIDQASVILAANSGSGRPTSPHTRIAVAKCTSCERESVFVGGALVHPIQSDAPPPSPDMPAELTFDFEEARHILPLSARGAAALLRLVLQKLLPLIGATAPDINTAIGQLVSNGTVNQQIQRALDSVRVVGNEAVHPGTMDLRDDVETAIALFRLINLIIQRAISEPNEVNSIYSSLPTKKLDGIDQRDRSK